MFEKFCFFIDIQREMLIIIVANNIRYIFKERAMDNNNAWDLVEDWKLIFLGPIREAEELVKGETPVLCRIVELHQTSPTELANYFGLTTARIATILNKLEKKGYINRIHDTRDRRKVHIDPTQDGIKQASMKLIELKQKAEKAMEVLGPEDGAEYLRLVKKLATGIKQEKP